jgi:hypothetical protein
MWIAPPRQAVSFARAVTLPTTFAFPGPLGGVANVISSPSSRDFDGFKVSSTDPFTASPHKYEHPLISHNNIARDEPSSGLFQIVGWLRLRAKARRESVGDVALPLPEYDVLCRGHAHAIALERWTRHPQRARA